MGLASHRGMATQTNRKFAVITGASSGIGYELARQCLEHDYDVLICAEDNGIISAATSLGKIGPIVMPLEADLSTREGCDELIAAIDRPVDALLLNAGVGRGGAVVDIPLDAELNRSRCATRPARAGARPARSS